MADRLPLGALPLNGITSPRSYATPSKAATSSPAARTLDFSSPFSPEARADAGNEARLLTALNTRLKKRLDDVERTAAKGGWERAACRTAAKKELDELCDAVNAALGDAPPQAEGGPNAALRNELLRSFDALASAVAAVPAVVAPVQRALADWAGVIGSAVASSLPLPQLAKHKPLPPLPTQQPAVVASTLPQAQTSPVPGGGAAVAAAIAAVEVTSEMTSAARAAAAATPDAGALMSPAWWARPDPKAEVAAEAEAAPAAPEVELSVAAEEAPAKLQLLPAAAGGCCVIS